MNTPDYWMQKALKETGELLANADYYRTWAKEIQDDAIASLEQDKAILDWLASLNYVTCNNTILLNNPILNEGENRAMRLRLACLKAMKGNE